MIRHFGKGGRGLATVSSLSAAGGQGASAGIRYRGLPGGIWALGLVSMFTDVSSELVHSLLPIFMSTTLGASMFMIGIVEGVAEGTALAAKVLSGALSDYMKNRKRLVMIGYTLSALTKPMFPLAASIGWVLAARFIDRVGKGIRGAPRDALVADIAPPRLRGAAFGLRQALDSIGAFAGPLLAVVLMTALSNDIKAVLWAAVVPACFAVFLLTVAVREPDRRDKTDGSGKRLALADAWRLPSRYWSVVALGAAFSFARFSEAFLILRARDVGVSACNAPTIMIVMNIVYSAFAYPAGAAADRFSSRTLLLAGIGALVLADAVLATAISSAAVFGGAALWGLHMAFTQGLLPRLVADSSPLELRGTAFGLFNLASGAAMLSSSVIAGALWNAFGASAAFAAGAAFAAVAATGVFFCPPDARAVHS